MSTTTPVDEVPPMETTLELRVADRCDRCGAQAFVITLHEGLPLYWCAHHYERLSGLLDPAKALDKRDTINSEASTAAY